MSKAELFTELTNLVDVDPFALLGVSLSADEKRLSKRYRQIAKQLHPDALASADNLNSMQADLAAQIIARIVNPSYQKLKHEHSRQESLATLRFRVRRLVRTEKLIPTFAKAQQLAEVPDGQVDIFYEQALTEFAASQFLSLEALYSTSLEICQLNLIFLSRKLESTVIRPKRAGLMVNVVTPTSVTSPATMRANRPIDATNLPPQSAESPSNEPPTVDYAQKHVGRAKTYLFKQSYDLAVQELREALKLTPKDAEIHSMLGQIYYKQKLLGMAKAHFRQALRIKPEHRVAQKYIHLMGLSLEALQAQVTPSAPGVTTTQAPTAEESEKKPWLGRLLQR